MAATLNFLSSALDGGESVTPRPGRFTPRKETRYPSYRRLDGPQGRSGWVGNSPLTGIPSSDRLASCESLYRLSHRGSLSYVKQLKDPNDCTSIAPPPP